MAINWDHWTIEPADPSVGIMSEQVIHEACPKDEGGWAEVSDIKRLTDANAKGYSDFEYTFTCEDCGATATFVQEDFVGFEE